ncbi:MAG: HAMP domain-containing protein [Candidatus Latescibacteria bacterium]|nr:HAMP domain-containing protein [Candidatus Latescibacterota bacterium]
MPKRRINKLGRSLKKYVHGLSIHWKIAISILFAFIIILPSVSMSLFYFTGILSKLTVITDGDVRLGRMATDLSLTMLDIRRSERNFRMFGGLSERESAERLIAHADSVLVQALLIAPSSEKEIVVELREHLEIYSNSFNMLVEHIGRYPPETAIQQKTRLSRSMNEFQAAYRSILSQLEEASAASRDSILAEAVKNLDIFSIDLAEPSSQGGQPSYIQDNLDRSARDFLSTAHLLAERSWKNMQKHKEESLRIDARAKRNIITVLILTGIVGVFMVVALPRIIMRPIVLLSRILKKAQDGDFTAIAPVQFNDEIGGLARGYNSLIERFRSFDELKTRKIASQKRAFDRFIENLDTPACILAKDRTAVYYNSLFSELFGASVPPKPPENGLNITQVESMRAFAEGVRQKVGEGANNFVLEIHDSSGAAVRLKGRIVRNALMKLESVVLIGERCAGPRNGCGA